jgi:rRNA maturation RNase YbeY
MSPIIEVNCPSLIPVPFDAEQYVESVLDALDLIDGRFEFSFVDRPTMIEINTTHLAHTYSTDIITFNLADPGEPIEGDIYICLDHVQDNAIQLGHSFEFELKIVMIHGVLHLIGHTDYTDADKAIMDERQLSIFNHIASHNA